MVERQAVLLLTLSCYCFFYYDLGILAFYVFVSSRHPYFCFETRKSLNLSLTILTVNPTALIITLRLSALSLNSCDLIPSVFHADQRGMCTFLIRTLGPELQVHPRPHGRPQHQQGQGLILEDPIFYYRKGTQHLWNNSS